MENPRHWRMQSVRYRLEGVRYKNGEVSLQNKPNPPITENKNNQNGNSPDKKITHTVYLAHAKGNQ